jgi:hypothetical protein
MKDGVHSVTMLLLQLTLTSEKKPKRTANTDGAMKSNRPGLTNVNNQYFSPLLSCFSHIISSSRSRFLQLNPNYQESTFLTAGGCF